MQVCEHTPMHTSNRCLSCPPSLLSVGAGICSDQNSSSTLLLHCNWGKRSNEQCSAVPACTLADRAEERQVWGLCLLGAHESGDLSRELRSEEEEAMRDLRQCPGSSSCPGPPEHCGDSGAGQGVGEPEARAVFPLHFTQQYQGEGVRGSWLAAHGHGKPGLKLEAAAHIRSQKPTGVCACLLIAGPAFSALTC